MSSVQINYSIEPCAVSQESWANSIFSRIASLFWKAVDWLFPKDITPQEMKNRNVLAHFHHIANLTPQSGYERGSPIEMASQWERILKTLPEDLKKILSHQKVKTLVDAFHRVQDFRTGEDLAADIRKGNLVLLPVGSKEHCVYAVFYRGYLSLCNRAPNLSGSSVSSYKIDLLNVTKNQLDRLMSLSVSGKDQESMDYIYRNFLQELKAVGDETCRHLKTLSSDFQKVDNCSLTSAKEGLMAAYAMLGLAESSFTEVVQKAKNVKKVLSAHARAFLLNEYLSVHAASDRSLDRHLVDRCLIKTLVYLKSVGIDVKLYPFLYQRALDMTDVEKSTLRTALLRFEPFFIENQGYKKMESLHFSWLFFVCLDLKSCLEQMQIWFFDFFNLLLSCSFLVYT